MDMDKTTILLPRKLRLAAQKRAKQFRISLGELIRRKLEEEVQQPLPESERSKDPMFAGFDALGIWEGEGPSDMATNHDAYIYDKT